MKMNNTLLRHNDSKTENHNQVNVNEIKDIDNSNSNQCNNNKDIQINNEIDYIVKENYKHKEERRLKQEEYKRILDNQRKEELERKEKERQRDENHNGVTLAKITTDNAMIGKDNSIINQQNTANTNINTDLTDKEIEKERGRQKKMEYYNTLQIQIEETRKRKEIEKQNQMEEENRYKANNSSNLKYLQFKGKNYCFNQLLTTEEQMILQQQQQQQKLESSNNYQSEKASSINIVHYPRINYNDISLPPQQFSINKSGNAIIPPLHSYSSDKPNNIIEKPLSSIDLSSYNTQFHLQEQLYPQYNTSNTNQFPNIQRGNTPMSNTVIKQSQSIQQPIANVNEIFQTFVNQQMSRISDYESKVETVHTLYPNKNKDELIQILTNERNSAIEKILQDQHNIKSKFGFYPMQNEFNKKISNLLNLILDKMVAKINNKNNNQSQAINHLSVNKEENAKVNGASIVFQPKNPSVITVLKKVTNKSNDISKGGISIITSQLNRDIKQCNYYSKYEDIKQSMSNPDDASPEIRESLAGYSKLVTPNDNYSNIKQSNSQNLYQTWKEDYRYDGVDNKNSSKLESIDEEKNNNKNINHHNYNQSQSRILMANSSNQSHDNNISNNVNLIEEGSVDYYQKEYNKDVKIPRPNSPLYKSPYNSNNNNSKVKSNDKKGLQQYNNYNVKNSSHLSSNQIDDSYSDNIINDLQKYRRIALDISTVTEK